MARLSLSSVALVFGFLAAASVVAPAQSKNPWTSPRTSWGDPDLQGVWSNSHEINVPFERPAEFGMREYLNPDEVERVLAARNKDREDNVDAVGGIGTGAGPGDWYEYWNNNVSLRTSIVVDPPDGKIPPLTAEAKRRADALAEARKGLGRKGSWGNGPFDGPEDFSNYERCITRALPDVNLQLFYNNNYQIVQGPGSVAILYEMIHESRVIPLDGRPHSQVRQMMGDSRGHWAGQTLVVDVTNFTDKTNFRGSGDTLHLVERFTRLSPTQIRYEVTVDDPTVWTRPWTARSFWDKDAKQAQVFEYACHEGNYGMFNMLSGARAAEKAATESGKRP